MSHASNFAEGQRATVSCVSLPRCLVPECAESVNEEETFNDTSAAAVMWFPRSTATMMRRKAQEVEGDRSSSARQHTRVHGVQGRVSWSILFLEGLQSSGARFVGRATCCVCRQPF
jgi:hypothetical protein